MSVLRDMICLRCGEVEHDIMANVEKRLKCQRCGRVTRHRDACNGGLKARYRLNDWPDDPKFYRGQVSHTIEPVVDLAGDDVDNIHTGEQMGTSEHYSNESMDIRRDKLEHNTDRKRGTLPMVFDQTRG